MTNPAFFAKDHHVLVLVSSPYRLNQWMKEKLKTKNLLLSVSFVASSQVIKEPRVHLHEGLENIVDKSNNSLVPMLFTYSKWHHVKNKFLTKVHTYTVQETWWALWLGYSPRWVTWCIHCSRSTELVQQPKMKKWNRILVRITENLALKRLVCKAFFLKEWNGLYE